MEYTTILTVTVLLTSPQLASAVQISCPPTCQSCDNERVMCRGASITSIPPLSEETLVIDFTQNDITSLEGLPNLPNVQSMRLPMNKLTVITGGAFETMPLLMSLDLSMNRISKVYAKGFKGLDNLMSLSLMGNKLSTIGAMIEPCKSVTTVRLGNNEITSIEEGDFQHNTQIKMLDLSYNKIKNIHPNAFKNLDMLRYLILSNNPLTTVQDLTFTSNILSLVDFTSCMLTSVPKTMPPSLNDFRLGNNKIMKIYQDDFQNITSLRILFLNDNEIKDVEHRAFAGLDNLKELWLSRNQLVYIPRGLPMKLEKLLIDNNNVVELEPMLFKNGSKLMKLSLESNNVRKVHQDSLKDVHDLDEMNLQGNQISLIDVGTFTKVPNLKILKLSYNPIQVFENGAFENLDSLSELYLSYLEQKMTGRDRLLEENILSSMPNLTKIDLTSSVLLTERLFELFEQDSAPIKDTVKTVILQYNELGTIPERVKQVFPNAESLILDGNPFNCDKRLQWLNEWMGSSSVTFHQNEELACNKPASLKGRLLSQLTDEEFVDEVTEAPQDFPSQDQVEAVTEPPSNKQPPPSESGSSEQSQSSQNQETDVARQASDVTPDQQQIQPSRKPSSPYQPSRSQSSPYGVRVVIKPPSGPSRPAAGRPGRNKLSKEERAARKAARQAEKARKRRLKAERKARRKKQNGKGKNRRKKRKVRRKERVRKQCKLDENGVMQCTRRRRCIVDDQGNAVCRKRIGKKNLHKDSAA